MAPDSLLSQVHLISWAQTVRTRRPDTCPRPPRRAQCHSSTDTYKRVCGSQTLEGRSHDCFSENELGAQRGKATCPIHGARTPTQSFFRLKFHGNRATRTSPPAERRGWGSRAPTGGRARRVLCRLPYGAIRGEIPVLIPLHLQHQVPPSHSKHAAHQRGQKLQERGGVQVTEARPATARPLQPPSCARPCSLAIPGMQAGAGGWPPEHRAHPLPRGPEGSVTGKKKWLQSLLGVCVGGRPWWLDTSEGCPALCVPPRQSPGFQSSQAQGQLHDPHGQEPR